MWTLVFRKIVNNKWMISCLLLGFIIVVAMVSSVPIYTDGILQRMLTKDLENFQTTSGRFPGSYKVELNITNSTDISQKLSTYQYFKSNIEDELIPMLDVQMMTSVHALTVDNMKIAPVRENIGDGKTKYIKIQAMTEFNDHVELVSGRLPQKSNDGVYEVLISEGALKEQELSLNEDYNLQYILDDEELLKVKIVGVFTVSDTSDPYWFNYLSYYNDSIFMAYDDFCPLMLDNQNGRILSKGTWFYGFDYHKISIEELPSIMKSLNEHESFYNKYKNYILFRMPTMTIFNDYESRAEQLKTTLWIILIPMLLMLCFYIFMVSQLIVNNEETEIAVMRSRGASSYQIFLIYLLEGLVLAGIAMLAGPPIGFNLCKILGASNGFLEFVSRAALPIKMTRAPYIYSAAAMGLFLITMLIPAFIASRQSIVDSKRRKSRRKGMPVWKKFGFDFIILGISAYGYFQYEKLNNLINATGVSGTQLQIDPLLFLISSMFIMGAGLLCLRVYPMIIRFIFWAGKKFWSPTLYASFINVGRSSGQEQFLMLFIILSIAVGIFNANSARTLNRNAEDKINYAIGADVVLDVYWDSNQQAIESATDPSSEMPSQKETLHYVEPNYKQFEELKGVESVSKVFTKETGVVRAPNSDANNVTNVKVMGIEPNSFGKTAWFRDDLLPHHFFEYLNIINGAPKGVLVSSSLKEKLGLSVGDPINVTWGGQTPIECTVYAFIDYWPSYNTYRESGETIENADCIVANLSYLQSKLTKEPYQVWVKRADGVTDTQINDELAHLDAKLNAVIYSKQRIIEAKNDPLLQGLNGMLTLSFVITMIISAIGFLIYWILSIKSRALQFGIFRAMGMSLMAVIGIIIAEQFMISVVAIIIGIVLGGITSDLFVPMMQLVYNASQQVPPFIVVADREDYFKIYAIIAAMLSIGIITISRIIAKIKIAQALKLGED